MRGDRTHHGDENGDLVEDGRQGRTGTERRQGRAQADGRQGPAVARAKPAQRAPGPGEAGSDQDPRDEPAEDGRVGRIGTERRRSKSS